MDFKIQLQQALQRQMEVLEKYPNRYREIHKGACKNCPSVYNKKHDIIDPEHEDIRLLPRGEQLKSVFTCGWRPSKLCKGYCDELNIKEKDLILVEWLKK